MATGNNNKPVYALPIIDIWLSPIALYYPLYIHITISVKYANGTVWPYGL